MMTDALTCKQEEVKTQKEKNIISCIQVLIESSKMIEQGKIISLDMEPDSTNVSDSINVKDMFSYELVN